MGQYVCVGIQNKVMVPKKGLDEFKEEYSHEALLDFFEKKYGITDVYDRKETETEYLYQLKDDVVEKELLPFLKDFYPLRYHEKERYELALEKVAACKDVNELKESLASSYTDYDNAFQIIEDSSLCFLSNSSFDRRFFTVSFQNVSLSIDGKILMEYYASFFAFIRRCLRQLLKKYRLADSIRIWIDG